MLSAQRAQHGRQQVPEYRASGTYADAREPTVTAPAHGVYRIVDFTLDPVGALDQFGTRRGRVCQLAKAFDELHAQPLLELAHLETYRRLSQVEVSCRCGKTPELDDLDDGVQLIETQASHLRGSRPT
jgi:hypothetical protein